MLFVEVVTYIFGVAMLLSVVSVIVGNFILSIYGIKWDAIGCWILWVCQ